MNPYKKTAILEGVRHLSDAAKTFSELIENEDRAQAQQTLADMWTTHREIEWHMREAWGVE